MIEIHLKPRTAPDGSLILELGIAFRVVFGALAAVLAVGVGSTGMMGIVPIGVLSIMVVGALYQEKWIFNPTTKRVTARHGLVVAARTRTWMFDDISEVQYAHHRVGGGASAPEEIRSTVGRMSRGLQRHFLKYWLLTRDGARVRIEMRKVGDWSADIALPHTVADTLSVPLTDTSR